jgi:glycosyltransferase involved in cell wall biosynthesis
MKKILLMIDDASVGGGQVHVLAIAGGIDKRTYEVHVACEEKGFLVDKLKQQGIPHHTLEMSNRPDPRSFLHCHRLLRRLKPDIIHTHGGTAGVVARVVSIGSFKGKRIHTYHGLHYLHERGKLRNRVFCLADRILRRATDRLVCVAESDRVLGKRFGVVDPSKTVLIRPAIDVHQFKVRDVQDARRRDERFVVGTIGRMHVQKGHRYLLDAAVLVRRDAPEVVFSIVGEGELRVELEKIIRDLELQSVVVLHGARTDTSEVLASFDCFVLPSLWEGLPIVMLEAMASGVPVVATDVDGVREAVENGKEALLVPPGDPEALARAIREVRDSPEWADRLARQARNKVESAFDLGRMLREIEQLYDEVLAE